MPAGDLPPESLPENLAAPELPVDDGQSSDTDSDDSERYIVPALRRGLSVLRLFSRTGGS